MKNNDTYTPEESDEQGYSFIVIIPQEKNIVGHIDINGEVKKVNH